MNYQILPPLADDEFAALKADIAERGVQVPIEVDEAGAVLDGHHRLRAVAELRAEGVDVADAPVVRRVFADESAKRAHVRALNLNRRHLTQEQRRALIAEQLAETPERSDRQIATALGVSNRTVTTERGNLVLSVQSTQTTLGERSDGRAYRRGVFAEEPQTEPRRAQFDIPHGTVRDVRRRLVEAGEAVEAPVRCSGDQSAGLLAQAGDRAQAMRERARWCEQLAPLTWGAIKSGVTVTACTLGDIGRECLAAAEVLDQLSAAVRAKEGP